MFYRLLRGARKLDAGIAHKMGPAYSAIFTIGLAIEIGRHVLELGRLTTIGSFRDILSGVFFCLLLLHQLAEFSEAMERRRERRRSQ